MANPLFDTLFGRHTGQNRPFLIGTDGHETSYDTFLRRTARLANALTQAGLAPGDRLAAQIDKSPDALALYAACAQAGVVFLPLNPGYTPGEVAYFVQDSGARLLVCAPDATETLTPIAKAAGARLETLHPRGGGSLGDLADHQPDTFAMAERSEGDLAALLYTSGTTGRSKGAMLTQANLVSNAETLAGLWRFTADDVLLHALPIFHTHGLFVATNTVACVGGAMLFVPKFDVDTMIDLMPRATTMMGVPTFYTRLLDSPRFTRSATAGMRLFVSGSAPLLTETHTAFEARTGHRILERYGMTETNMNTSNPYDGDRRAGTVGLPLPGVEVIVTDPETGTTLPPGNIGQVEVRGPNVFKGYWQMPEKTAAELRESGFFQTGDLGRVDADGYLHIVGRDKDLIISGGYNVYPKEVELVLDAQPDVLESAVIGVPHPDLGEAVVAVLVPRSGGMPDAAAIVAACDAALARYKQPRRYEHLPELPRNAMGKVQKNVLRDRYAAIFAQSQKP